MERAGLKTHPWPAAYWCGGWGPCPDEPVILLPQSRTLQQLHILQGPHGGCVEAAEGSERDLGAAEDPMGTDPLLPTAVQAPEWPGRELLQPGMEALVTAHWGCS